VGTLYFLWYNIIVFDMTSWSNSLSMTINLFNKTSMLFENIINNNKLCVNRNKIIIILLHEYNFILSKFYNNILLLILVNAK